MKKKKKKKPKLQKQFKEKKELFDFIKSKVIEYYKNMSKRLSKDEKGIESINLFLNNVYKEMSRKYKNATRIYFKHPRCEVLKKTYKVKTSSKGVATFKITNLKKKGTFTAVVTYAGSKYYNKVTKKPKITVKK